MFFEQMTRRDVITASFAFFLLKRLHNGKTQIFFPDQFRHQVMKNLLQPKFWSKSLRFAPEKTGANLEQMTYAPLCAHTVPTYKYSQQQQQQQQPWTVLAAKTGVRPPKQTFSEACAT
jgi:hypothetical protein